MSKGPERQEIATTRDGRDITQPYGHFLRLATPTDAILQANGSNYVLYEEVYRDDQVKSCFQQRQLAVVSKPWVVEPGDDRRISKKAADFISETLKKLPWDDITSKMLLGVFYGYAVAECLWGVEGGLVTLEAIKVRKQRRFGFAPDHTLRLLTMANPHGEEVPERKFWCFTAGADHHDDPYGLGLAHWLYWPVKIKRGGLQMWTAFLDKFGIPTAKGTYPATASTEQQQTLLNALAAIQSESGVVVPEGMTVELLEASRGGQPGYDRIVEICNEAIAKVVLSQTMTTDNGSSQSQATVHLNVRDDLVEADADSVCDSFNNSVCRWLTEWNFPGAAVPRVRRETEDSEDLNRVADRIETLARAGWEPGEEEEIDRLFGGKWRRKMTTAPPAPEPIDKKAKKSTAQPAFAEAANPMDAADVIIDKAMASMPEIFTGLTDQVRDVVMAADSWESLRGELLAMYPDLDATALSELLAQAITLAELAGRWEVNRGR